MRIVKYETFPLFRHLRVFEKITFDLHTCLQSLTVYLSMISFSNHPSSHHFAEGSQ